MDIRDAERAAELKKELYKVDEMLRLVKQRGVRQSLNSGMYSVGLDKETFKRWANEWRRRVCDELTNIGVDV